MIIICFFFFIPIDQCIVLFTMGESSSIIWKIEKLLATTWSKKSSSHLNHTRVSPINDIRLNIGEVLY